MSDMIKVSANIKVYPDVRKHPIFSGYTPIWLFSGGRNTSGQIIFNDRHYLLPGDDGIVDIVFVNRHFLGREFGENSKGVFSENGSTILGEIKVLEIIDSDWHRNK